MLLVFAQSPFQSPGAPQVVQNANALEDNYNKKKPCCSPCCDWPPYLPFVNSFVTVVILTPTVAYHLLCIKKSLFSKLQTILFWK